MTGNGQDNISSKTRALINELFSDPVAISGGESGELRLRIAELEVEVERLKVERDLLRIQLDQMAKVIAADTRRMLGLDGYRHE